MICIETAKNYCKDYTKIENYEEAVNDKSEVWECHHRNGSHYTENELKDLGLYYNCPPCELIFLTRKEHEKQPHIGKYYEGLRKKGKPTWNKGKKLSEEHKRKLKENHKGTTGKKFSKEGKQNISDSHKGPKNPMYGKHPSEETRAKLRVAHKDVNKGKHFYNDGEICIRAYECPKGFKPGMLRKGDKKCK